MTKEEMEVEQQYDNKPHSADGKKKKAQNERGKVGGKVESNVRANVVPA